MALRIRRYRAADRPALEGFFEAFQDELAGMDPLARLRRGPDYGARAADRCLRELRGRRGLLLIAEDAGQPLGFAAGVIEPIDPEDAPDTTARLSGRVVELYVAPDARHRGVATRLVQRLERYFAGAGCDTSRISVFAPNAGARAFYARLGYLERDLDLIRPLAAPPDPADGPATPTYLDARGRPVPYDGVSPVTWRVSAYALARRGGRVLMVKQGRGVHWELPGGAVETPERLLDAAVRECLEETGHRFVPASDAPVHVAEGFFWKAGSRSYHHTVVLVFAGEAADPDPAWSPFRADEIREVACLDPAALTPDQVHPNHWPALRA